MFEETRREAIGFHHFASGTRRKIFTCKDRRENKKLQGEVQKLEKLKANNIKKYDDEIKDWKEILKQLQDEKEAVGSIQCLIEANRETLKSSMTARRQNAIKSIRRSLAPQPTQDFSHKSTVNHQLISKPTSLPRKIKVELMKREQIRLNEGKLSNNDIKPRKPENTNVFLDDAVAMYAKLRREIMDGPEKKSEILSSAAKHKSMKIKAKRPITVPSGNFKGLPGTKKLEDCLRNRLERSKTFGGFVPTAHLNSPPQTTRKTDKGRFAFKSMEARGSRITNNDSTLKNEPTTNNKITKHKKTGSLKKAETKPKINYLQKKIQERTVKGGVIRMPKVQFASTTNYTEDTKESEDSKLKWKGKNEIVNKRHNSQKGDVQEVEKEELPSQSCSLLVERETTNDIFAQSNFKNEPVRRLSNRITSLQREDKPRTRIDAESKTEQGLDDFKHDPQRYASRKLSLTGSPRRHSQSGSISTNRLSEIISEQILEQVTNTKRRFSISSNQKTSILKSYARMLQNQLKMDDVPEIDSPDFSDTPFMRSKKDQHEMSDAPKTVNDQEIQSTLSQWSLWKSQVQLGALQSSFDYSEIEEENVLNNKERRRMSVRFFGAAGIATRKERGARLKKLKKNHGVETVDEEGAGSTGEKYEL